MTLIPRRYIRVKMQRIYGDLNQLSDRAQYKKTSPRKYFLSKNGPYCEGAKESNPVKTAPSFGNKFVGIRVGAYLRWKNWPRDNMGDGYTRDNLGRT